MKEKDSELDAVFLQPSTFHSTNIHILEEALKRNALLTNIRYSDLAEMFPSNSGSIYIAKKFYLLVNLVCAD